MPVLSTDTARLNGMPKPSAATTPFHLVYGGDSYLNDQTVRDLKHEAQRRYPDAETIELDAASADHYAFDEAVSPSLLADRAIVIVTNLQNADEKLGDAMVSYCRQACKEPADACIVICQHEGGVKANVWWSSSPSRSVQGRCRRPEEARGQTQLRHAMLRTAQTPRRADGCAATRGRVGG